MISKYFDLLNTVDFIAHFQIDEKFMKTLCVEIGW